MCRVAQGHYGYDVENKETWVSMDEEAVRPRRFHTCHKRRQTCWTPLQTELKWRWESCRRENVEQQAGVRGERSSRRSCENVE